MCCIIVTARRVRCINANMKFKCKMSCNLPNGVSTNHYAAKMDTAAQLDVMC